MTCAFEHKCLSRAPAGRPEDPIFCSPSRFPVKQGHSIGRLYKCVRAELTNQTPLPHRFWKTAQGSHTMEGGPETRGGSSSCPKAQKTRRETLAWLPVSPLFYTRTLWPLKETSRFPQLARTYRWTNDLLKRKLCRIGCLVLCHSNLAHTGLLSHPHNHIPRRR